jgi:membrane protease YdiL (CAAX protease family)
MRTGGDRTVTRCALAVTQALLFWLGTMALLAIAGAFAGSGGRAILIVGAVTVPPTFAFTALFIRWDQKRLRDYGFEFTRGSWGRFAGGLVLGSVLIATQTALMLAGGGIRWVPASPKLAMLPLVAGYLLLATREELAFRGFPLRRLASAIRPWPAQIIVALLFIVEHRLGGSSWANAVIGSGMGALVFGMAALATKGLAFPIGLHAAWNVGDWARGTKGGGGLWNVLVEPGSSAHVQGVAMTSYVGVMALAFAGLWLWYFRTRSAAKPIE